jgi:flagellar basal-body rod protein FlgB
MNFLFDPTVRLLEKSANFRMARQEVVASNLANVDTPGFIAKDVPFDAYLAQANAPEGGGSVPVATNPRHIGAMPGAHALPPPIREEGDPTRVDGNNVVLEKEMTKMAENTVGYLTEVTLVSRKLRMIRSAIDDSARV